MASQKAYKETVSEARKAGRPHGRGKSYENRATHEEVMEMLTKEAIDKYDTARILGVHPEHVLKMAREGKLPGFKVGNAWRFHAALIVSMLKGQQA